VCVGDELATGLVTEHDVSVGSLAREIGFTFEPQPGGGYHAYAPELPGLHTERDDLDEAVANAQEARALYIEGL